MSEEAKPLKKSRLKIKKSDNRTARILQIFARVLAGLDTLAGIFVLGIFLVITLMYGHIWVGLIFLIPMCALIVFYIISLKAELVGGLLLICEGIGFIIFLFAAHWSEGTDLLVTLSVAVLFMLSGILFIIAWYLEKYKKR